MVRKLRIREAMDSSIPSWLRKSISDLSKPVYQGRYGRTKAPSDFARKVDAANTIWHPMPVPRTAQEFNKVNKDPNMVTVVRLIDDWNDEKVWLVGYNDSKTAKLNGVDKELGRHAAKNILPYIEEYGYLEVSPEALADLRKSRRDNPAGEDRNANKQYLRTVKGYGDYDYEMDWETGERKYKQGPPLKQWETKSGYDKSGYTITGIDKYKAMLAELGLKNYERTMDKIYDSYEALTSLVKMCRGSKYKMDAYRKLSNYTIDKLMDVEREYEEYQKEQKYYPDDNGGYYRGAAEQDLKRLREYTKKIDEFISHISADDWTDRDYEQFAWRL